MVVKCVQSLEDDNGNMLHLISSSLQTSALDGAVKVGDTEALIQTGSGCYRATEDRCQRYLKGDLRQRFVGTFEGSTEDFGHKVASVADKGEYDNKKVLQKAGVKLTAGGVGKMVWGVALVGAAGLTAAQLAHMATNAMADGSLSQEEIVHMGLEVVRGFNPVEAGMDVVGALGDSDQRNNLADLLDQDDTAGIADEAVNGVIDHAQSFDWGSLWDAVSGILF